jgi:hypothetical protein
VGTGGDRRTALAAPFTHSIRTDGFVSFEGSTFTVHDRRTTTLTFSVALGEEAATGVGSITVPHTPSTIAAASTARRTGETGSTRTKRSIAGPHDLA